MAHQPPQRDLVHHAVTKRRDERQPETAEVRPEAGRFGLGRSKVGHGPSPDWPETGHKKPHLTAGVSKIGCELEVYRARRSQAPKRVAFFEWGAAQSFVIIGVMMRCAGSAVNGNGLGFFMMKTSPR